MSIIHDVFVLPLAYFPAIFESGNIFLNNFPAWSAMLIGNECSMMNSVNKTSAFVISKTSFGVQKNEDIFKFWASVIAAVFFFSIDMSSNVSYTAVGNGKVAFANIAICGSGPFPGHFNNSHEFFQVFLPKMLFPFDRYLFLGAKALHSYRF